MSSSTFTLRIKAVEPGTDVEPGHYWTLDDGPEDLCFWAGPHTDQEAAKQAAVDSIKNGYAAAAKLLLTGE